MNLTARVGSLFATPLVVNVLDQFGNPVPSANITFIAPAGEPTCTLETSSRTTDDDGRAAVHVIAGTLAGDYEVVAIVDGTPLTTSFAVHNIYRTPSRPGDRLGYGSVNASRHAVRGALGR